MRSVVWYWWRGPARVWAVAVTARLRFGVDRSPFTTAWSFGPVTVALTDVWNRRNAR